MGIGDVEDQRFLRFGRVKIIGEFVIDGAVKRRDYQVTVKVGDFKILIVFQGVIDYFFLRVDAFYLFVFGEINFFLRVAGDDLNRRILVDQKIVDNRGTVGITVNRFVENLYSMQRRGGGESDFYRIEVIENATVGRDVIQLVAELQFVFGLFFIENIVAMRFVNDDIVVTGYRYRFI